MNKLLVVGVIAVFIAVIGLAASRDGGPDEMSPGVAEESADLSQQLAFSECLSDAGVVVYGNTTCPACTAFANQFGGYEAVEPIFVECRDNPEQCQANMQTEFIPEIQLRGERIDNPVSVEQLAELTECEVTFL